MADLLKQVGDALGLNAKGNIAKLLIQSWPEISRNGTSQDFAAFINPEEFTYNYNVVFPSSGVPVGSKAASPVMLAISPLEMSFRFFLDQTGSTGTACNVADKINQFYTVCGHTASSHQVRYLSLVWGHLRFFRPNQLCFDCVLKTASIQYKMFDADGTPLRAIITGTFVEAMDLPANEEAHEEQSADLTHIRIVKEDDTLPGMAQEVYGDFRYYLEVARVNRLKNFRQLQPGQRLLFPPFDKNVSKRNHA